MSLVSIVAAGVAGVSALAYCLYNRSKKEPSYQYCHGSTYGALYLMSCLQGDNKNSLIPFGLLENIKIPVFSGECFRGISDSGINRKNTSWVRITDDSTAVGYSKRFPFSFEDTKKYLEEIIRDNDNPNWSRPPYAGQYHSAYWNKILLRIRQVRAWDEPTFQKELKDGLARWIKSEIDYFETKGRHYVNKEEQEPSLIRMKKIQDEIQESPNFQLNEEDKWQILKTYPIVFLTSSFEIDYSGPPSSLLNEFGIAKKLTLGKEIQGIATEPQFIDEVRAFIQLQGLAKKVKVISFAALALEKLNHFVLYRT